MGGPHCTRGTEDGALERASKRSGLPTRQPRYREGAAPPTTAAAKPGLFPRRLEFRDFVCFWRNLNFSPRRHFSFFPLIFTDQSSSDRKLLLHPDKVNRVTSKPPGQVAQESHGGLGGRGGGSMGRRPQEVRTLGPARNKPSWKPRREGRPPGAGRHRTQPLPSWPERQRALVAKTWSVSGPFSPRPLSLSLSILKIDRHR